ncbi:MAG: NAD-dependent epimerase/dehydratase family protein [Anaerolineae bacterium]|nr:NAD-dependent epimerase/dehydratase family protein [Anaerolineae bacterium]
MSRRILITGGAGFIGGHLAERLIHQGEQVVVLDNLVGGNRMHVPSAAEFVQGDVRRPEDLAPIFDAGVDVVLHLAGQASIRLSFADPSVDLNVNTLGTINILQACLKHQTPRLLFASSMTIYGHAGVVPTSEDTSPAPVSYYAVSKYAAERYVHLTAARRDLGFDFKVTSLRMFNVYGERQSLTNAYQGVLAIFIGNVLRGEPITIHADGEQSRDFVHIDDVCRAWIGAVDTPTAFGQVINIGTGTPTTVNDLCDLVLASFGHSRDTYPIRYAPAQPGDMRCSTADRSLARTLMGWEPQVLREEGMARTIAWAKAQIAR